MSELVRRLGSVKIKKFEKDFDQIVDLYKEKATKMGYHGELRFNKENGKMVIMVVI